MKIGSGRRAAWTSTTSSCMWSACSRPRGRRASGTARCGRTCSWTSTRTRTARSTASSSSSPRRTATSAWWAIPISPCIAGAAPISETSSTSRRTSRIAWSSPSSRTTARPSASWTSPPGSSPTIPRAGTSACGRRTPRATGPRSIAPGTRTRRRAGSPRPSALSTRPGPTIETWRCSTEPMPNPASWKTPSAGRAFRTSSWVACASTSGARSRTSWPICVSWSTPWTMSPSDARWRRRAVGSARPPSTGWPRAPGRAASRCWRPARRLRPT